MPCKIYIHDMVSGGVVIYDEDGDGFSDEAV